MVVRSAAVEEVIAYLLRTFAIQTGATVDRAAQQIEEQEQRV